MNCHSECDCNAPGGYPHEPDCHWYDVCDHDGEGAMCDKHMAEQEAHYRKEWLRAGGSTDAQTQDQMRQDMIDAGRSHLLPDVMADRIDRARMMAKEEMTLADELSDVAAISDQRRNS